MEAKSHPIFKKIATGVLLACFFTPIGLHAQSAVHYGNISIRAVVAGCGNGILESGEECDGSDFGGSSCVEKGFFGGQLACSAECKIEIDACVDNVSAGVVRGGGGDALDEFDYNNKEGLPYVFIEGFSYPNSIVYVMRDYEIVEFVASDIYGRFWTLVEIPSLGNYVFSVYAKDYDGGLTSILSMPIYISSKSTVKLDNIILSPTISVKKIYARGGTTLEISGNTQPDSEVLVYVKRQPLASVVALGNGVYKYYIDVSGWDYGVYEIFSKSKVDGRISPASKIKRIELFARDRFHSEKLKDDAANACDISADVNGDCRVDSVDFVIMRDFANRKLSGGIGGGLPDLNSDGVVDIVDYSILAYYWTG